jgi:2-alkyl-3-oxoalkanoate reductase
MKVFVAGATGVVGKRLVPLLVASGYEVVGMTRARAKEAWLRQVGAEPVVADGLDRAAVMQAVLRAEPEVVIHEMTGLTGVKSFKKFDDEFALTNLSGAQTHASRCPGVFVDQSAKPVAAVELIGRVRTDKA